MGRLALSRHSRTCDELNLRRRRPGPHRNLSHRRQGAHSVLNLLRRRPEAHLKAMRWHILLRQHTPNARALRSRHRREARPNVSRWLFCCP